MVSLGLTLTLPLQQSPTRTRPSTITNKYSHQKHHHINILEYKLSGSKFIQSKSNKVGKSCIIKASSEGSTMSTTIEKLGVKVVRNPPDSKLSELGVLLWPKWGCPPSRFPWTYDAKETCYLLQGKVKVYPAGSTEAVEIGAGDLVVFPKGMSCTWDVSEAVDKHYKFE